MVSFAAYSSLQSNEEVSLSDLAMENAEALAGDINLMCPTGCLDIKDVYCLCIIPNELREAKWNGDDNSPDEWCDKIFFIKSGLHPLLIVIAI